MAKGNSTGYVKWDNDPNNAGKTSLDTIVDWMLASQNYARYRGNLKTKVGDSVKTKDSVCKEINQYLVNTGHKGRKPKQIRAKISDLESKFKEVVDMLNGTGFGCGKVDIEADHGKMHDG